MVMFLGSARATEFIARVRLRPDDRGDLQVYTHFGNGTGRISLGMPALASVLDNRWDRIRIEQLGRRAGRHQRRPAGSFAAIDAAR